MLPQIRVISAIFTYILILVWACATRFAFTFVLLWRVMLYILACALFLAIVAPDTAAFNLLAQIPWNILVPLIWLTTCDIARHSSIPRVTTVCICLSAYSLPFFIGSLIYTRLIGHFGLSTVAAGIFLVLFLVIGLCLEARDPDINRIFEDLRGGSPLPDEFDLIDASCAELAAQSGLTQRETEVMKMICKGMSRTFIAESLFISENTVKAHASHVYAKLDVHGKEELQELVGIRVHISMS